MKKISIIYDSHCTLCSRFKQALEIMDSKRTLEFFDLHEEATFHKFSQLSYEQCLAEVHLIDDENKVYTGDDVIKYLIQTLPGVKKIAWLVEKDSGSKAVDFFYKTVNSLRKKAKPCSTCNK